MKDRLLIVGYGNDLRRDDALGCLVARHVDDQRTPSIRGIELFQLVPELASQLAETDEVIFVDASVDGSRIGWLPLDSQSVAAPRMGHFSDPRWILHLCHSLYGRSPQASLMTIPAKDLGFGEGLSPEAKIHFEEAIRRIDLHIHRIKNHHPIDNDHPVPESQEHGG